jgi:hypothetical protein
MVERVLEEIVKNKLNTGKAIVVLGARQVGKNNLVAKIIWKFG